MNAKLTVVGRAEAVEARRARFDAPAVTAIRYADPAAWITVTAVADAMEAVREAVMAAHDRVGLIVTSAEGPVEAMAAMGEASRAGSSSPIRFPASNAGSLAGLASIAFGFRGPTLMLTLPADRGVPVAVVLAEAWLRRGVVDYVAVAATFHRALQVLSMGETPMPPARPVSRCLFFGPAGAPREDESEIAWLAEGR